MEGICCWIARALCVEAAATSTVASSSYFTMNLVYTYTASSQIPRSQLCLSNPAFVGGIEHLHPALNPTRVSFRQFPLCSAAIMASFQSTVLDPRNTPAAFSISTPHSRVNTLDFRSPDTVYMSQSTPALDSPLQSCPRIPASDSDAELARDLGSRVITPAGYVSRATCKGI